MTADPSSETPPPADTIVIPRLRFRAAGSTLAIGVIHVAEIGSAAATQAIADALNALPDAVGKVLAALGTEPEQMEPATVSRCFVSLFDTMVGQLKGRPEKPAAAPAAAPEDAARAEPEATDTNPDIRAQAA